MGTQIRKTRVVLKVKSMRSFLELTQAALLLDGVLMSDSVEHESGLLKFRIYLPLSNLAAFKQIVAFSQS